MSNKRYIRDGRKVVAASGTAVPLSATTVPILEVTVTAEEDNENMIVVGHSTVVADLATRRGTPLMAGESYTIDITNLMAVYIDSVTSGEGVSYTYITDVV